MPKENKRKRLMGPEPDAPDAARRRLLTGGALTVAASAAALGTARAGDGIPGGQQDAGAQAGSDHRITDHIAAYYARARG